MLRLATLLSIGALALIAASATALDLEITGTFTMESTQGTPGADLAAILGNENSWSIALQDVQFVCDPVTCFFPPLMGTVQYLLAASFSFQFSGPDATLLNAEVGQHFTQGGLYPHLAFLSVSSGDCDPYQQVTFYIFPSDPEDGVYMEVNAYAPVGTFSEDLDGCPSIEPFLLDASSVALFDRRGDNDGNIFGFTGYTIAIETPVAVEDRS
jgi:hypothetical protein